MSKLNLTQTKPIEDVTLKICPLCDSSVSCYNTAVISGENQCRTHYLLACTACGYGPAQAFSTRHEAVSHWNHFALNTPAVELS